MTTPTYHQQLRERIVAARKDGHSAQEVAGWFKVSKRSVERFWKSYLETGRIAEASIGSAGGRFGEPSLPFKSIGKVNPPSG